ncbi:MAG: Crp/Fnr family transcriptional regulator [Gemmatimonadales bacterium]
MQITTSPPTKRAKINIECATALATYGARTTWPSNFQIYQKGTRADGVSLVLRGHVILRNRIRTGRGFVPAIVTPGETFGAEGLTNEAVYVTDCYATENAETLFLSGEQFRAFVRENPGVALLLIDQLMRERTRLLENLHAMASQNVEQRLVASLQRLAADRSFLAPDGRIFLELRHHRLLCEMVGATRESIALALGRLVGMGVAERQGVAFLVAPSRLAAHITHDGVEVETALSLSEAQLPP